jgi:tol-pal system protein YbgF
VSVRLHRAPRAALAALLVLGAAACSLTKPEEEPAYVKATAVEGRVERIERQNQALVELAREVESLKTEMRSLHGDVEELQHTQKASSDQQRDLYADLDRRMQALDARVQGIGAPAAGGGAGSASANANDRDAYQAALDRLKNRDYEGAEHALKDFLGTWPQSALTDNAKYWLGETYYVERRYPEAIDEFDHLVREHPDSRKVPDALLKAGYAQYEQKRYREARELLARVQQSYPDSSAANEARERLRRMDAERR